MNNIELRKFCIEIALKTFPNCEFNLIKYAAIIYDYILTGNEIKKESLATNDCQEHIPQE